MLFLCYLRITGHKINQTVQAFKIFYQLDCKSRGLFTCSSFKYAIFRMLVKVELFLIYASIITENTIKQKCNFSQLNRTVTSDIEKAKKLSDYGAKKVHPVHSSSSRN